jgi:carbon storage regulator
MLVLSRQKDETIMIGDDVEITVVDIRGDKVRLGIKAPPHIPVHRKEVYEAIKRENKAASQVSPDDLKSVSTSNGIPTQGTPADTEITISEPEVPGPRGRRRNKPADSNKSENKNKQETFNNNGCEGTQPTGSK